MIKRIIFDLDDTLITWKDEYWKALNRALDELKIQYNLELVEDIKNAIGDYEKNSQHYNKKDILIHINKCTRLTLKIDFIELWLKNLENCIEEEVEKSHVLKELAKKYELVVLTNWFRKCQVERLENTGWLKFFDEVYDAEDYPKKPYKESYIRAMGNNKPNECIMIGDSYENDVKKPLEIGMNAIYYNPKKHVEGCMVAKNFNDIFKLILQLEKQ